MRPSLQELTNAIAWIKNLNNLLNVVLLREMKPVIFTYDSGLFKNIETYGMEEYIMKLGKIAIVTGAGKVGARQRRQSSAQPLSL